MTISFDTYCILCNEYVCFFLVVHNTVQQYWDIDLWINIFISWQWKQTGQFFFSFSDPRAVCTECQGAELRNGDVAFRPKVSWLLCTLFPCVGFFECVYLRLEWDGAQWLERLTSNPKTSGSIPWRGRVTDNFSVPLRQLLCRLSVPDPPSCVWYTPKFMSMLKTPYPSVIKK